MNLDETVSARWGQRPEAWLWLLVVLFGIPAAIAESPEPSGRQSEESSRKTIDYRIVVTGGELLSGVYADGHTLFLTRTLLPLGLRCVGSMSVGDTPADIDDALRFAREKAGSFARGAVPLVIVTGGLGPTENDVTRETLAQFTGIPLAEQPEVLEAMERRFGTPRDRLRANLLQQTRVPTRGTFLKNSQGTSFGLVFELDDGVIVALPGPPRELQPMVHQELVPYLSRRFGTRLPGCSLTVRFVGLGQSRIDQTLEDHNLLRPDVTVFSHFEGSRVDFTFSLPDDTATSRQRLVALKTRILAHLGESVYADKMTSVEDHSAELPSLEDHVVGRLAKRGARLAVAETGSGGALAAALAGAVGSEHVLAGAYVAPNEAGLRRLLGFPEAGESAKSGHASAGRPTSTSLLADAAARATGSSWAMAVGEPREDAAGNRLVEVVLKLPGNRIETRQLRLRGHGELAHTRLTTQLLDLLR